MSLLSLPNEILVLLLEACAATPSPPPIDKPPTPHPLDVLASANRRLRSLYLSSRSQLLITQAQSLFPGPYPISSDLFEACWVLICTPHVEYNLAKDETNNCPCSKECQTVILGREESRYESHGWRDFVSFSDDEPDPEDEDDASEDEDQTFKDTSYYPETVLAWYQCWTTHNYTIQQFIRLFVSNDYQGCSEIMPRTPNQLHAVIKAFSILRGMQSLLQTPEGDPSDNLPIEKEFEDYGPTFETPWNKTDDPGSQAFGIVLSFINRCDYLQHIHELADDDSELDYEWMPFSFFSWFAHMETECLSKIDVMIGELFLQDGTAWDLKARGVFDGVLAIHRHAEPHGKIFSSPIYFEFLEESTGKKLPRELNTWLGLCGFETIWKLLCAETKEERMNIFMRNGGDKFMEGKSKDPHIRFVWRKWMKKYLTFED